MTLRTEIGVVICIIFLTKNEHCTELNEHMVCEVIVKCVMVR